MTLMERDLSKCFTKPNTENSSMVILLHPFNEHSFVDRHTFSIHHPANFGEILECTSKTYAMAFLPSDETCMLFSGRIQRRLALLVRFICYVRERKLEPENQSNSKQAKARKL